VTLATQAKLPPGLAPKGKDGKPAAGTLTLALTAPAASPVTALAFRPDGKLLAIGRYGRVTLWDLTATSPAPSPVSEIEEPHFHIHALEFSPDGRLLAVGGGEPAISGGIVLYDATQRFRRLRQLAGHTEVVYGLAFSADGKRLASASLDKTARIWSLTEGRSVVTIAGHSDFVYAVRFSADDKSLLTASVDRSVKVSDAATGKSQRTFSDHTEGVLALAVSPDGKSVVSAGIDRVIRWWNFVEGTAVRTLGGHGAPVAELVWSRDGKRIASASADKSVRLWDGASGALQRALAGSTEALYAVALSPDAKTVAAGGWDGQVRLWSADTGKLRLTLLCGPGSDWLAVLPEGFYEASPALLPRVAWRVGDMPMARGAHSRIEKALHRGSEVAKALSGAATAAVEW
jgi:WD40 repeat protein